MLQGKKFRFCNQYLGYGRGRFASRRGNVPLEMLAVVPSAAVLAVRRWFDQGNIRVELNDFLLVLQNFGKHGGRPCREIRQHEDRHRHGNESPHHGLNSTGWLRGGDANSARACRMTLYDE